MKYLTIIVFFLTLLFTQCSPANKAAGTANAALQQLIDSKNYTFVAQYAQPLNGRQILLTSLYDLTVRNDTLISNLPYFGRAFVAPVNPSEGGIMFTSTNFDYAVTPARRGGYNVVIRPKEENMANQLILNITSDGAANLQVFSANRQAISFRGTVRAPGRR